jgi:hypothetical protein
VPLATALFTTSLDYPIASDRSRFSMQPQFSRFGLRVGVVLRFDLPGGDERVFTLAGDPGLVRLDPRWNQAATRFVGLGFAHILSGVDHLLFLVCLILPVRRFRQLLLIVTAFTVAHSITLFAAAFGWSPHALWFTPVIETLIAASIVYMALENIVIAASSHDGADGGSGAGSAIGRRWAIAFAFGLVHGFGFSFALQEKLQLAGSHLVASLISFNVGVELGQIVVLAVLMAGVWVLFRMMAPRVGIIIASALVAHTAWHWMIDRGAALRGYDWGATEVSTTANLLRWAMVAIAAIGTIWFLRSTTNNSTTNN